MIPRYTDHAANERTYLAWLRTGIAVTAFGVVVERFDLFMRSISRALAGHADGGDPPIAAASPYGRELGAVLVVAGLAFMAISTWRFWGTGRRIDSVEAQTYDRRNAILLGGVVIVLGLLTLGYVLHTMARN